MSLVSRCHINTMSHRLPTKDPFGAEYRGREQGREYHAGVGRRLQREAGGLQGPVTKALAGYKLWAGKELCHSQGI